MTSSDRNSAKVSRASLRFILPNAAYFYASTDKCTEVMCKMRPQNDVTGVLNGVLNVLSVQNDRIEWCSKETCVQ